MRPLPKTQLHYADAALNDAAQLLPITPYIDLVHYPTIGAPALLSPEQLLTVVVSLPEGVKPTAARFALVDRHGGGESRDLVQVGQPASLGLGPETKLGKRELWQVGLSLLDHPPRLYDLCVCIESSQETQPNSVRIYASITGNEKVVFCGDSQFHLGNEVCLEQFVEHMNQIADVAWIALIGDVCDNGVRGSLNILRLVLSAQPGPVHSYYEFEYPGVRDRLARLNKPIVLIPGNHDGMVAYNDYLEGMPTDVYLGPDSRNVVAYDGLHHFRRTFGPLYFSFDWHKTRYICLNSFELDRHQRLGFHAVVTNWGGWIREEQQDFLLGELQDADRRSMHKVALMHHDPRGGSEGKSLGYYKEYRAYNYHTTQDVFVSYMGYLFGNSRTWQQEWMRWRGQPLAEHPVKRLLGALLEHRVWAVFMGHDNASWVDSYFDGGSIFISNPAIHHFAATEQAQVNPASVRDIAELIADGDLARALILLQEISANGAEDAADEAVSAAVERLAARQQPGEALAYAPRALADWGLAIRSAIHFVHVNNIGAYKHRKKSDLMKYGYVLATLKEGRPISLQRQQLGGGKEGTHMSLLDD